MSRQDAGSTVGACGEIHGTPSVAFLSSLDTLKDRSPAFGTVDGTPSVAFFWSLNPLRNAPTWRILGMLYVLWRFRAASSLDPWVEGVTVRDTACLHKECNPNLAS